MGYSCKVRAFVPGSEPCRRTRSDCPSYSHPILPTLVTSATTPVRKLFWSCFLRPMWSDTGWLTKTASPLPLSSSTRLKPCDLHSGTTKPLSVGGWCSWILQQSSRWIGYWTGAVGVHAWTLIITTVEVEVVIIACQEEEQEPLPHHWPTSPVRTLAKPSLPFHVITLTIVVVALIIITTITITTLWRPALPFRPCSFHETPLGSSSSRRPLPPPLLITIVATHHRSPFGITAEVGQCLTVGRTPCWVVHRVGPPHWTDPTVIEVGSTQGRTYPVWVNSHGRC